MKLNLGASNRPFSGYLSVDIAPPADVIADLSHPWPWPDSSVEAVKAFDIAEHIEDRIHFMNELWRVMRNGAQVEIEVPSALSAGAFQDPTHKSFWVRNSFQYFQAGSFAQRRFAKAYGINARFNILHLGEKSYQDACEPVIKISAVLECVK